MLQIVRWRGCRCFRLPARYWNNSVKCNCARIVAHLQLFAAAKPKAELALLHTSELQKKSWISADDTAHHWKASTAADSTSVAAAAPTPAADLVTVRESP